MAKHQTTWVPDTCSCEITYEWDDTENPVVTFTCIRKVPCDTHNTGDDNGKHFNKVLEENRRKNVFYDLGTTNFPSQFGPDKKFDYYWDNTVTPRVLHIRTTLTNQQKNNLQNIINVRFGAGLVVLD